LSITEQMVNDGIKDLNDAFLTADSPHGAMVYTYPDNDTVHDMEFNSAIDPNLASSPDFNSDPDESDLGLSSETNPGKDDKFNPVLGSILDPGPDFKPDTGESDLYTDELNPGLSVFHKIKKEKLNEMKMLNSVIGDSNVLNVTTNIKKGPLLLLEEEDDDIEYTSEEQGLYALEPDVMSVHKLLSIEEYSLSAMEHSLDHTRIKGRIHRRRTSNVKYSPTKTHSTTVRGPEISSSSEKSILAADSSVLNKVLFALINNYRTHTLHIIQVAIYTVHLYVRIIHLGIKEHSHISTSSKEHSQEHPKEHSKESTKEHSSSSTSSLMHIHYKIHGILVKVATSLLNRLENSDKGAFILTMIQEEANCLLFENDWMGSRLGVDAIRKTTDR
jgi:hypothetical protein